MNSTLAGQAEFVRHGEVSPIHQWGFQALVGDAVLAHRLNRYEVVLRSRIRGLDLRVLGRFAWYLWRGYRRAYLVTPPDLFVALPLLKRFCPGLRVVTWAWVGEDVRTNLRYLRHCDHVFCLTESALQRMADVGLGERASLQFWGTDPESYVPSADEPLQFDVSMLGRTKRDLALVATAIGRGEFGVAVTHQVERVLRPYFPEGAEPARLHAVSAESQLDVARLFQRSRATWIPLLAGDVHPTGYTNLAESLLCGAPAVVAIPCNLPRKVLELPGVFMYRLGDVESFMEASRKAVDAGSDAAFRTAVRDAAAHLLNGRNLKAQIIERLRG